VFQIFAFWPRVEVWREGRRLLVKTAVCPVVWHVYQRVGGIPAVMFRVGINERREVAAGAKCERSESSEEGWQ